MIIFLIAIIIIGIVIFLIYNHKKRGEEVKEQEESAKKGSWRKVLIIISLCVICFFRFIHPGVEYSVPTIWFYVAILINIIVIILIFNKKLLTKKRILNCIIIIYFLLMIGLPVYKFDNHEHIFDDTRTYTVNTSTGIDFTMPYEKIIEYTNYYNCYGLRIYRQTK